MTGHSAVERARKVAAFAPAMLAGLVAPARSSGAAPASTEGPLLAHGVPVSPGWGRGQAYFDVESALGALDQGEAVVLVVPGTSPADEPAIRHAAAVVTSGGGLASHAAIVARGWGVPAVCGVEGLHLEGGRARFGDAVVRPGDELVVDGSTGVIRRAPDLQMPARTSAPTPHQLPSEVTELLGWADEINAGRVAVLANAESPEDVAVALRMGAAGVGLCRSEHWFLGEHRQLLAELLAEDRSSDRPALLTRFGQIVRTATEALLDALDGAPATVRLLDAPPEEFEVPGAHGGGRGVRAARLRSDLYRAQLSALIGVAAASLRPASLRVLVPMVSGPEDLEFVSGLLGELQAPTGVSLPVGAMIEVPRAALTAAAIARRSAFLSIGTNDLTALVWGLDRNAPAPPEGVDPFSSLDVTGVGRLIGVAIADARRATPGIEVGVCGEIAGDPGSIGPLVELGVTALSVSPYRVAAARLAVAQALIRIDARGAVSQGGAG